MCEIVSKTLSANIIYEDQDVICFLDINPISEGHALVCPKAHISEFSCMSDALVSKIFCFGKRMAVAFERVQTIDGVSLLQNNGRFNELGHFHLHVSPRQRGDGFPWKRSGDSFGTTSGLVEIQRSLAEALKEIQTNLRVGQECCRSKVNQARSW